MARFPSKTPVLGYLSTTSSRSLSRLSAFKRKARAIQGTGLGLTISCAGQPDGRRYLLPKPAGRRQQFHTDHDDVGSRKPVSVPVLINQNITGYNGARQTILVVDDIADQRNLVSNILTPLGFNILQANGAAEALKMAENHTIHLYILDITMPEVSGWQLAIQLRQKASAAPL